MKAIVAVDKNWGIGKDGDLLVHLPGDLRYFREKTEGKIIIIGRKTLESFPGGKPLPNRLNIVITRNKEYIPECFASAEAGGYDNVTAEELRKKPVPFGSSKVLICESTESAIGALKDVCSPADGGEGLETEHENAMPEMGYENAEAFVCGGGEIYRQFLDYCDRVLVTKIDADFDADTFFPNLDEDERFECIAPGEICDEGGIKYQFTEYVRKN